MILFALRTARRQEDDRMLEQMAVRFPVVPPPALDESDPGWRAVARRDATYDGKLVYAVRTTGIYCRPSCSSRRPKRENVEIFVLPEFAEQAGYRPCQRCRPALAVTDDESVRLVQRACRYIHEHLGDDLQLTRIAKYAGTSASSLQRTFKRVARVSPREYAEACRMRNARGVLRRGGKILDALYDSGFESTSRLYGNAGRQLGMTPATFRRGGAGIAIRFATAACPLGRLLVAHTARGICFVSVAASDVALERSLRVEFPAAEIMAEPVRTATMLAAVLRQLAGREPHVDLPCDIRATAFQRQVWDALRRIPSGETRTYAEIAEAVGRPAATRAVARACATNPVAIVVPCHRVVPAAGGSGGYRWGAARKKKLLSIEQQRG